MSKSKIFIGISLSFIVGILAASAFGIPRFYLYLAIATSIALFAMLAISKYPRAAFSVLFLFCIGLGALRLQFSMKPNEYQDMFNTKQQLEGYVVEEVNNSNNRQQITFRPKGFQQNILITNRLQQPAAYGDRIVVQGTVKEPAVFEDFDYQSYLQRFNVYAVMSSPKILPLKSHQLNPIKEILLNIKTAFINRLEQLLNEPQSSLAVGILIGGHGNLPQNIVDDFSRTGISHVIAVSGFNISVIVIAVTALVYALGRRLTFWLSIIIIAGFVIITGGTASVVRAAIMGILLTLSSLLGRQYSIVPAIFFAAVVMLLINPKILYWDVGFQLSFAATLGIVFFYPKLDTLTKKLPQWGVVKPLIIGTVSAIIATAPLIVYNFGILSLSAPIVNVLVLPLVPTTMLFGFLSALPIVGPGSAMVANWLLVYDLKVVEFFAHLPYSYLDVSISVWTFWLLAAVVFLIYLALSLLAGGKEKSEIARSPSSVLH